MRIYPLLTIDSRALLTYGEVLAVTLIVLICALGVAILTAAVSAVTVWRVRNSADQRVFHIAYQPKRLQVSRGDVAHGLKPVFVAIIITQHHIMLGIEQVVLAIFSEYQPVQEQLVLCRHRIAKKRAPCASQDFFFCFPQHHK